jgi:hypothetical protein
VVSGAHGRDLQTPNFGWIAMLFFAGDRASMAADATIDIDEER